VLRVANSSLKLGQSVREFFWPRMGWMRASRYYVYKVGRLTATPHAIAVGFACGAFASFTPFMGFHLLLCMGLAYLLRGHIIASVIGTIVGNPLTFPMIWLVTYNFGKQILGGSLLVSHTQPSFESSRNMFELLTGSFDQAWPVIATMSIGGLALGIPAAIICYVVVRVGVAGFQRRRRKELSAVSARKVSRTKLVSPTVG